MSRAIGRIPRNELVRKASVGGEEPLDWQRPFLDLQADSCRPLQDDPAHDPRQERTVEAGRAQTPAVDEEHVGAARFADESLGRQANHLVRPILDRLSVGDPLAPIVERLVSRERIIRRDLNAMGDDRARLPDRGRQRPRGHPEDRARYRVWSPGRRTT